MVSNILPHNKLRGIFFFNPNYLSCL
ncbi:hypothetical protein LINPERPRIM_LOCUS38564 [Linum perenne]